MPCKVEQVQRRQAEGLFEASEERRGREEEEQAGSAAAGQGQSARHIGLKQV